MIGWILFTITVIFIIIWYVKKRFKISWQSLSSVLALLFSCFACVITGLRVEMHTTNDTFVGLMAGFMGACATILVGAQIYNSIDTKNAIKDLNKSFEEKTNRINVSFDQRMREAKSMQNSLEYELRKTKEELDNAKKEREKGEILIKGQIERASGFSLHQVQPFTSYKFFYNELKYFLEINSAEDVKKALRDIEVTKKKILKIDRKQINTSGMSKIASLTFEKLEKYPLSPLIKEKYQEIYKEIIEYTNKDEN